MANLGGMNIVKAPWLANNVVWMTCGRNINKNAKLINVGGAMLECDNCGHTETEPFDVGDLCPMCGEGRFQVIGESQDE